MENMISNFRQSELSQLFNNTLTENGDYSHKNHTNKLVDILFKCEYYTKNPSALHIGDSNIEKLFSMFIRDPRFGLGYKTVGRRLMALSGVTPENVVKAGSFKDFRECQDFFQNMFDIWQGFLYQEISNGNELAKKWVPRYSSKNLMLARRLAKAWGMNKQQYGHFVKCNTTENKLSRHETEQINFEHVPSLAMLKYYKRFKDGEDTAKRFAEYLESVKKGDAKLNVAVTTVYDLYKKSFENDFDTDLFFDKIEKISGSWIPIVDTSGSMWDSNDSIGKAMAIGHYLAKCSTYCPNQVLSFSSRPQLITLGQPAIHDGWGYNRLPSASTQYGREVRSMYTGDCSSTDFGAVMNILSRLKEEYPEYLVVLSDMQFNCGGYNAKERLMKEWRSKGINTKIVWWNFNSRGSVSEPDLDEYGNVFLSGYSPMLLRYMDAGFNAETFLMKLLAEYAKNITK